MMISTRGRYALRVMIDLAEHRSGGFIPLKDVARRQAISQKYLEGIMTLLSKNELVEGLRGKEGGYRLSRDPKDYRVGDILRITEGTLAPVACLGSNEKPCERAASCKTLPLWTELDRLIAGYLDSVTLADLSAIDTAGEYVI